MLFYSKTSFSRVLFSLTLCRCALTLISIWLHFCYDAKTIKIIKNCEIKCTSINFSIWKEISNVRRALKLQLVDGQMDVQIFSRYISGDEIFEMMSE